MRKPKNYISGSLPVNLKITVDGQATEISTKRKWDPARWSSEAGRAIGNKEDAKSLNSFLDTLESKVHEARRHLLDCDKEISAKTLKNYITGVDEDRKMILEVFAMHNKQIETLIPAEYSPATLTRYKTSLDHTRAFMESRFRVSDMDVKKLNYEFISEYEFWLKSVRKCSHNTAMKYLANFKKIVLICVKSTWLQKDPFTGFKLTKKEVTRPYLTAHEIKKMAEKEFPTERLKFVRDIFLFSCYTGLAYADVKKLHRSEIVIGPDGDQWIFTSRQKTGTESRIPLLPYAIKILNRYEKHPQCPPKAWQPGLLARRMGIDRTIIKRGKVIF